MAVQKYPLAMRTLKPPLAAASAHVRALFKGAKLAPGSLVPTKRDRLNDPRFLLMQAARHGPIFKTWSGGKMTTCICSLALGRRFLAENETRIRAATTDFATLFPHGTLRQMTGATHSNYRRIFVDAFKAVPLETHETEIRSLLDDMLDDLSRSPEPVSYAAIRVALKRGLTEILLRLILGIDRHWHGFDTLISCYERYAPNGTFLVVRPEHQAVYGQMAALVQRRAEELSSEPAFPSLLAHLAANGRLDDTAIGNLVQMVEAARFDLMGLWSWLVQMLGANPHVLDHIAELSGTFCRDWCEAATLEALRLEQSEFVLRRATSDIVFDQHFIPKRSRIRICVWEAHKDPKTFDDPFRYDPKRFVGSKVASDAYSPFGLDRHRCAGADWVIQLSSTLVERAALTCRWQIVSDGTPELGVFHFEPNRALTVIFSPVNASRRAGR